MVDTFCVYLGPTIRGVIQYGTIYPGGRAATLERLKGEIAKYPLIAELISEGDALVTDRIKVKTKGNYLYEAKRRLVAELTKGER